MFSSWIATLIEIQALGSSFNDFREGNSSSHKLLYSTGGQRLPTIQGGGGGDMVKLVSFLSPFAQNDAMNY